MATVFKKTNPNGKESPFWYGSIKRADGTWIKKSTKQSDRNKAVAVALAWQEAEREAGGGSLTHQRTLEILNETLKRTGEKSIEVIRARQWLEDWLKNKEATASGSTVKEYRIAVNGFLKQLGERADLSLEAIRPGDILEWREMLRLVKEAQPDNDQQPGEDPPDAVRVSSGARHLESESGQRKNCRPYPGD